MRIPILTYARSSRGVQSEDRFAISDIAWKFCFEYDLHLSTNVIPSKDFDHGPVLGMPPDKCRSLRWDVCVIKDQNVIDLCKYHFEQAKEALCEEKLLQEPGNYRGAINRVHYAMFYSLQVLVIVTKKLLNNPWILYIKSKIILKIWSGVIFSFIRKPPSNVRYAVTF